MALLQFLCGLTVIITLLYQGCESQDFGCGVALLNTRIVGGQEAVEGSWPWQASLDRDGGPICGGTLINNQWVLTAAHCVTGNEEDITVHLGRQSQSLVDINEVSRDVTEANCHPMYNSLTNDNDICLLKLSEPVTFTSFIQPICLAAANSTFHSGTSSWVTGFGDIQPRNFIPADTLQEVNIPVVGNNECRCYHTFPISENMICAGLKAGEKDACQGDSGGPLMSKGPIRWVQSGVVSFGEGCGRPESPGVYARVSRYQEWISNVTGSSQPYFVTFTSQGVDRDANFTCPTRRPFTSIRTTTDDNSIFSGGENVITHFTSLCVLILSLYVLVGVA